MEKRDKIYWHEAFYEAMELELYPYRDALTFQKEHLLSKEALRLDLLVIKKNKNIRIEKNIGRFFKTYNIFEFKSELDTFSQWDYEKVRGYVLLYASFNKVPLSGITLSVALTQYPRKLINRLESERGLTVRSTDEGIYQVEGDLVPIQILESKRLPPQDNVFLRSLRSNLNKEELHKAFQSYEAYKKIDSKNVLLDRLVNANPDAFKEVMSMFTDSVKKIFLEGAKMHGWLEDEYAENEKVVKEKLIKKMLLDGEPIEKIARWTDLPIEEVASLA